MNEIHVRDLGRISYGDALRRQERLVEEIIAGSSRAHLLLLEHAPPVITLGRRAKAEHILLDAEQMRQKGYEVFESKRGGDVTFHGPGQLVAYPIVRLGGKNSVRNHMRSLEQSVIDLLAAMDINGTRKEGFPGVWTESGKVASVGVAVRRWVTYHGLSLNVEPDTSGFDSIVPCGLGGISMTSVTALAGKTITVHELLPLLAYSLCGAMGFEHEQVTFVGR